MKKAAPEKKAKRDIILVDIDDFDTLEYLLEASTNQKVHVKLQSFDASIRMSR